MCAVMTTSPFSIMSKPSLLVPDAPVVLDELPHGNRLLEHAASSEDRPEPRGRWCRLVPVRAQQYQMPVARVPDLARVVDSMLPRLVGAAVVSAAARTRPPASSSMISGGRSFVTACPAFMPSTILAHPGHVLLDRVHERFVVREPARVRDLVDALPVGL
jgi:hypothetical protein